MLSYGYKNTVGVVAHLFFSDPPLRPHANVVAKMAPVTNFGYWKVVFMHSAVRERAFSC